MTDTTISALRTSQLRVPWAGDPPANGIMAPEARQLLVLEIETRGGLTGMGYLQLLSSGVETVDCCLREMMGPRILGRDATEVEGIWQDLWRSSYWLGRGGIAVFALSAIDIALWDILGKRADLPLHRLWGNCRAEVPAYGSGCWRGLGRDGMIERARQFTDMGFTAIKMQAAHLRPWREDVKNVHAMRQAMGEQVEIMVDVNMGWSADTAIQAGAHLDEADIYWLEEPVVCEDYAGYQRVAGALRTRVVGGESHFTRYDLRPFFAHPSSPILQPDPMRGGLTELRKIAAIAETYGLQLAPHLFHELNVHVLASVANANYLEYMDWNDDLWVEPRIPVNGMLPAPGAPGHGVVFKPDLLLEHRVGGFELS